MLEQTYSQEFEVQQIIDEKPINGQTYYLVKWIGYGHEENTWEPLRHMTNVDAVIKDWQNYKEKQLKFIENHKGFDDFDLARQKNTNPSNEIQCRKQLKRSLSNPYKKVLKPVIQLNFEEQEQQKDQTKSIFDTPQVKKLLKRKKVQKKKKQLELFQKRMKSRPKVYEQYLQNENQAVQKANQMIKQVIDKVYGSKKQSTQLTNKKIGQPENTQNIRTILQKDEKVKTQQKQILFQSQSEQGQQKRQNSSFTVVKKLLQSNHDKSKSRQIQKQLYLGKQLKAVSQESDMDQSTNFTSKKVPIKLENANFQKIFLQQQNNLLIQKQKPQYQNGKKEQKTIISILNQNIQKVPERPRLTQKLSNILNDNSAIVEVETINMASQKATKLLEILRMRKKQQKKNNQNTDQSQSSKSSKKSESIQDKAPSKSNIIIKESSLKSINLIQQPIVCEQKKQQSIQKPQVRRSIKIPNLNKDYETVGKKHYIVFQEPEIVSPLKQLKQLPVESTIQNTKIPLRNPIKHLNSEAKRNKETKSQKNLKKSKNRKSNQHQKSDITKQQVKIQKTSSKINSEFHQLINIQEKQVQVNMNEYEKINQECIPFECSVSTIEQVFTQSRFIRNNELSEQLNNIYQKFYQNLSSSKVSSNKSMRLLQNSIYIQNDDQNQSCILLNSQIIPVNYSSMTNHISTNVPSSSQQTNRDNNLQMVRDSGITRYQQSIIRQQSLSTRGTLQNNPSSRNHTHNSHHSTNQLLDRHTQTGNEWTESSNQQNYSHQEIKKSDNSDKSDKNIVKSQEESKEQNQTSKAKSQNQILKAQNFTQQQRKQIKEQVSHKIFKSQQETSQQYSNKNIQNIKINPNNKPKLSLKLQQLLQVINNRSFFQASTQQGIKSFTKSNIKNQIQPSFSKEIINQEKIPQNNSNEIFNFLKKQKLNKQNKQNKQTHKVQIKSQSKSKNYIVNLIDDTLLEKNSQQKKINNVCKSKKKKKIIKIRKIPSTILTQQIFSILETDTNCQIQRDKNENSSEKQTYQLQKQSQNNQQKPAYNLLQKTPQINGAISQNLITIHETKNYKNKKFIDDPFILTNDFSRIYE